MYQLLTFYISCLLIPVCGEVILLWCIFRTQARYKKVAIGFLVISGLPFIGCITPFVVSSIQNQVLLIKFAKPFYDYPLPSDTVEIDRHSRVINITQQGTWNHCVFVVARTIQTSLSKSELEEYYENALFRPIYPDSGWKLWRTSGKMMVFVNIVEDNVATITIQDGIYTDKFMLKDPRCWTAL